jgi:NACHT domain
MADVFLAVSAAIIKASLKIWLGNDGVIADATYSIIDILKNKISGDLEQRQAQRLFEDLEVPVSKQLRTLRESEFRYMPENEWTASVLAAGDSFDRAGLTAQELFTRDMDPLFLERHIRAGSRAATRDLSADGVALYDRLISRGCAYIIEIADKLPHFNAGAFTELLRRDRQILEMVSKVLDRIPEKADGVPEAARFATAYVQHLATKLDRLELFGLDFESPWYPLSLAYVSLRVDSSDDQDGVKQRYIEDRLAANQRTMILGRAGSGKTTILQWIAVRAARSDFTGVLADLNGHIPFFIRLREYVGSPLPQPEEFVANIAPMLAGEMPSGWARDQLRSGHAVLLIDGVDELPESERERVVVWLQDLIQLFPGVRYVVTTRPTAVSTDWLDDLGFVRTLLEAMPPSLVVRFIHHWHEAARHRLTGNDEFSQLAEYEHSLLANIDSDRYLRDLADTPLLAGLLCALNRHLGSHLPRRRSEIYGRALSMFDQRDKTRKIVADKILLDLAAKTRILADLALWMIRNGESEVDEGIAIGIIGRSLSSLPSLAGEPEEALSILLERSGVLREPAFCRVDFVHRTFQEYLAAWTAVDSDVIGELVRNANDDQWREVLVMAAGQTNRPQTTRLMRGLLGRASKSGLKVQCLLLAVSCLEEVRSLDRELRQTVEGKIPSLLPPKSMEEAEQLSKAGELLVPLLARYWAEDLKHAPPAIRAASLVGGPLALDFIEHVVTVFDKRGESLNPLKPEILRAWQYFDADDYAHRVLNSVKEIKLEIDNLKRVIHALPRIASLEEILITPPSDDVVNLEILAYLPKLKKLGFSSTRPGQLQGLSSCRQVKHMEILSFPVRSIWQLEMPSNLELLVVESPDLVSLVGVKLPTDLIELSFRNCPILHDIYGIRQLPRLRTLRIFDCPEINRAVIPDTVTVIDKDGLAL